MSTIAERVARGAAWLDGVLPNWWKTHSLNLDDFDMADGCKCVVGQLSPFAEFDDAIDGAWMDLSFDAAHALGFSAGPAQSNALEYLDLQAEWRRIITERRAAE